MLTMKPDEANGELVIRTIAMPGDTNKYGDMFGGWVVSQMDLGGAILAHSCARQHMTTVAIDSMVFMKPIFVGDLVSCYAEVARKGRTSVTINVDVWVQRHQDGSIHHVTKGLFTFVAIDDTGRPIPIDWPD